MSMCILECHSHGDRRFSAFYARLADGRSIEEHYQSAKRDEQGQPFGSMRDAKGKRPVYLLMRGELVECTSAIRQNFYTELWRKYFRQYPELYTFACQYTQFRDKFAHAGVVYRIEDGVVVGMHEAIDSGCNQAMSIAWLVSKKR